MEGHPSFSSKDEEIGYWRDLAEQFQQEKEFVQREFDDYTTDSQQLEKEYEATIDQHEKSIRELRSINNKLQNELDSVRLKLEQSCKENEALQADAKALNDEKTQMARYIRELEQRNDDLERSERAIGESIQAIETALNLAIERNAILESEVDEKESLKEKLQRLADETRDLKQELQVKEKERCPDNERLLNGYSTPPKIVDSNRLKLDESSTPQSPIIHPSKPGLTDDYSIAPSQKIMALNIVGQLLRKVGSLEAKMGHSRNHYRASLGEDNRSRHSVKSPSPASFSHAK